MFFAGIGLSWRGHEPGHVRLRLPGALPGVVPELVPVPLLDMVPRRPPAEPQHLLPEDGDGHPEEGQPICVRAEILW